MSSTEMITIIVSVIGANIALVALISGLMIFLFNKVDGDINKLSGRMDGHATRIDQLYRMFVDLLKENK
jgi:hypothetical protein